LRQWTCDQSGGTAFPASRVTGLDLPAEGIANGTAEAERFANTNATFVQQDVAELMSPTPYDVITGFDTIHDQAPSPHACCRTSTVRCARAGSFLMVDIKASSRLEDNVGVPLAAFLYTISTMHCMTVPLALDGAGVGTVWGRQLATSMLADAGFAHVQVRELESDPFNYYYYYYLVLLLPRTTNTSTSYY